MHSLLQFLLKVAADILWISDAVVKATLPFNRKDCALDGWSCKSMYMVHTLMEHGPHLVFSWGISPRKMCCKLVECREFSDCMTREYIDYTNSASVRNSDFLLSIFLNFHFCKLVGEFWWHLQSCWNSVWRLFDSDTMPSSYSYLNFNTFSTFRDIYIYNWLEGDWLLIQDL